MTRPIKPSRRSAFTIVEIIVVVVLISILATLIVPRFLGRRGKTQRGVAGANMREIEAAIEMFCADYGRHPETLDELVHRPEDVPEEEWTPPTLRAKDLTDPWGRQYVYRKPGDEGRPYDLLTYGADGQPGGEGDARDVVNWE